MQSFKKKVSSATGKSLTLLEDGIEPFLEGKFNFENTNIDIELLAIERKNICLGCEFFENEPLESCQIKDKNIPELTNKMCGDCFCILSYKLRQSKTKCIKWLE